MEISSFSIDELWNRTWLQMDKDCVISEVSRILRAVGNPTEKEVAAATTGGTFQINKARLHVQVVTLSVNDNNKFLQNIRQGFKRTISCNKYRSEITTQPKNYNLDYLIDPTFRNINRLFTLSFKNDDNDPRYSLDKYYMSLVEIEGFNTLIDNKPFLGQLVKQETYVNLGGISIKNDYTTENVLEAFIKANKYKYSSTN